MSVLAATKEVDVLPWMARGTLEYVGQGVLGVSLGIFDPSASGDYADYANAIRAIKSVILPGIEAGYVTQYAAPSPVGMKLRFVRPFVPVFVRNFSRYWRNKLVDWLPVPGLREMREISYSLHRIAARMIKEKKDELERNGASKKNLMDLMREHHDPLAPYLDIHMLTMHAVRANMSTSAKDRMSDLELIGQIK